MKEKVIEVKNDHKFDLKAGESVNLVMTQSMGNKAVILGYFIPFVLVLMTLLILSGLLNELWAGLISLSVLVPYYIILSLFKDRLSKTFEFKIEPAGGNISDCYC
jgi:sigma-E factor negative regulatory protein RseC